MTGLELAIAIVGVAVTLAVVIGMMLIVPQGIEAAPPHVADPVPPDPIQDPAAVFGGAPDANARTGAAAAKTRRTHSAR
jgi:hypothetical protein